jgi:hypothetical protein
VGVKVENEIIFGLCQLAEKEKWGGDKKTKHLSLIRLFCWLEGNKANNLEEFKKMWCLRISRKIIFFSYYYFLFSLGKYIFMVILFILFSLGN